MLFKGRYLETYEIPINISFFNSTSQALAA